MRIESVVRPADLALCAKGATLAAARAMSTTVGHASDRPTGPSKTIPRRARPVARWPAGSDGAFVSELPLEPP